MLLVDVDVAAGQRRLVQVPDERLLAQRQRRESVRVQLHDRGIVRRAPAGTSARRSLEVAATPRRGRCCRRLFARRGRSTPRRGRPSTRTVRTSSKDACRQFSLRSQPLCCIRRRSTRMPAVSLTATLVATVGRVRPWSPVVWAVVREAVDGARSAPLRSGSSSDVSPARTYGVTFVLGLLASYVFGLYLGPNPGRAFSVVAGAAAGTLLGGDGAGHQLPLRAEAGCAHCHQRRVSCCSVYVDRVGVRVARLAWGSGVPNDLDIYGSGNGEPQAGCCGGVAGTTRPRRTSWRVERVLHRLSTIRAWIVMAAVLASAAGAYAQFDFGFRGDGNMPPLRPPALRDGSRILVLPAAVHERAARAVGRRLAHRLSVRRDQPDDPAVGADEDTGPVRGRARSRLTTSFGSPTRRSSSVRSRWRPTSARSG